MSDEIRNPLGTPADDDDGAAEGEVTEEDYEEVEDMDSELTETDVGAAEMPNAEE